jgi:hypothetical protein
LSAWAWIIGLRIVLKRNINYDKASIFFNFGTDGAVAGEKTYYFDDVLFGSGVLPVRLLKFDAVKRENGVTLDWTTASESTIRDSPSKEAGMASTGWN